MQYNYVNMQNNYGNMRLYLNAARGLRAHPSVPPGTWAVGSGFWFDLLILILLHRRNAISSNPLGILMTQQNLIKLQLTGKSRLIFKLYCMLTYISRM